MCVIVEEFSGAIMRQLFPVRRDNGCDKGASWVASGGSVGGGTRRCPVIAFRRPLGHDVLLVGVYAIWD